MSPISKEPAYLDQGRIHQKQLTRQRVLEAAAELIRRGNSPTVAEAADLAGLSRRTAYRYFQTQQQMLAEAALVVARAEVAQPELPIPLEDRLDATIRRLQHFVYHNEAALRLLEQQYMQHTLAGKRTFSASLPARRNRVRFIERALQELRGRLSTAEFDRLVSALVLCMGIEAAMALGYVRNLSPTKATEVCAWAAQQILKGALAESKQS